MIRVAFCCHGNICRSTLSESVFTHKVNALGLGDQFIIDSYNISISAPEGQESQIQPVNEVSTVNASESTTEPQRSPNWIEYITVILLAVLVGLEIKDKLHKEK